MNTFVKKKNDPKIEVLDAEVIENFTENSSSEKVESTDDIIDLDKLEQKSDLEILKELLPVVQKSTDLVPTKAKETDPLYQYINEISRYKLLSKEEEEELVKRLYETGDIEVARKLVMANLRLVVKIAMEYKSAYKNVMDLIQEGNMGLMKAVSKYNPEKGAKLSYYASWWIKSYILKFILDNFRLIKIGTTFHFLLLVFFLYLLNLLKTQHEFEMISLVLDEQVPSLFLVLLKVHYDQSGTYPLPQFWPFRLFLQKPG